MYAHPAVQANIGKLQRYGNQVLEAGYGELASGLVGQGRMAEPEEIIQVLQQHFREKDLDLA
jgi:phosphopantothenoylcysteine decarboxylase/phosphopantothenate--cysteine ligase